MKRLFWASLAMTAILSACSHKMETDNEPVDVLNPKIENLWSGTNAQIWNVVNQYVDEVIFPTYSNLAAEADCLYELAANMKNKLADGTLADSDIVQACEIFTTSRRYWELSEAFLYGAASDFNIDPHIDSWPLDREQMTQFFASEEMIAGICGSDPIGFVSSHNAEFDTALGFHGIEYILFRDGLPRKCSDISSNEISFLAAVAGDLRDHCFQLEVAWKGLEATQEHRKRVDELGMSTRAMGNEGYYYGADLLLTGYYNNDSRYLHTTYHSMPAVMVNILIGGCSNICSEVADQKMGQAWRVLNGSGSAEDAADYIESPYSKHSFIDYQGNIYSIRNSIYGKLDASEPDTNSISNFLKINGYPSCDNLEKALENAINSLQNCIDSGVAFVDDPGNARVKTAIDALNNLDEELNKAAQWISKL